MGQICNSEGFPNVIGEAMACGVPSVATNVGDSAAIVDRLGKLVPANDSAALSSAIMEILKLSPDERRASGAKSRNLIERDFDIAAMVKNYLSIYETVLDAR